jgi:hypothetical protein
VDCDLHGSVHSNGQVAELVSNGMKQCVVYRACNVEHC